MRIFTLSLLAFLLLAQTAAAQSYPAPADTVATRYQLPGADCALFPASLSFSKQLLHAGRFTPTKQQIVEVERALKSSGLLKDYARSTKQQEVEFAAIIRHKLKHYRRQYYGLYGFQNNPCLYINFFDSQLHKDDSWLKYRVHMIDAGLSVWSVCYDLKQNKFYAFSHESTTRF